MCPHVTKTNEVGRKDNYAHLIAAMNEIHKTAATSEDYFLPVRFYFVVQANFRFSITALSASLSSMASARSFLRRAFSSSSDLFVGKNFKIILKALNANARRLSGYLQDGHSGKMQTRLCY